MATFCCSGTALKAARSGIVMAMRQPLTDILSLNW